MQNTQNVSLKRILGTVLYRRLYQEFYCVSYNVDIVTLRNDWMARNEYEEKYIWVGDKRMLMRPAIGPVEAKGEVVHVVRGRAEDMKLHRHVCRRHP